MARAAVLRVSIDLAEYPVTSSISTSAWRRMGLDAAILSFLNQFSAMDVTGVFRDD
jgi:hypothetical protein